MASKQKQPKAGRQPLEELASITRAIIESALDCIITMDASGRVREFNPVAERTFGFSRAQAIGQELATLIIPERMREQHRKGLAHYLKTGEGPLLGHRIEIEALRSDGSEILVELAITVVKIDSSPLFIAYLRDITERKAAEDRFHMAAEAAPSGMIMADEQGRVILVNAHAEKLFGYSREELIGQPVDMLVPERFRTKHPGFRNAYMHQPSARPMGAGRDLFALRKDGSEVPVEIGLSPIKTPQGVMVLSAIVDISVRKQSERRRLAQYTVASLLAGSWTLEEASSAILQTIASIGDWVLSALWIYDEAEGKLRCPAFWDAGSEKLKKFGDHSRSVRFTMGVGLPGRVWESNQPAWIYDVTVDPNFPRAPVAREAELRGGFAFPLFAGQTSNGVIEMFSRHVAEPDRDLLQLVEAFGSQIGFFIERRRIERELQREKENAEAANAAKDRFLATLSHELRTPLTPVLIWAGGTANQPDLSPEMQQGLKMVCRNVELEARLIDDLFDLTRISRGKLQLQLRPADAHELLGDALEIVRNDIEDRHLKLSLFLDAARHEVHVDPPRLQQVFWNVFRNACKFTPEGGTISARSYNPRPNSLVIEISDSGVGIASESLEKIFEAFEQADPRREGLGLGLAIGKATIEMHGGTICARSEGLGKGATFVIELPVPAPAG